MLSKIGLAVSTIHVSLILFLHVFGLLLDMPVFLTPLAGTLYTPFIQMSLEIAKY